jgi:hypothetical protein
MSMFPPGFILGGGGAGLTYPGGTTDFLRADGSWAAPAGGASYSFHERKTGTSRGSTNTTIARHTTSVVADGADVTYTDSPTLGGYFTINTAGYYVIQSQQRSSNSAMGIRKDTALDNTFNITSETNMYAGQNVGAYGSCGATIKCEVNDLVWISLTSVTSAVADLCTVSIMGPF